MPGISLLRLLAAVRLGDPLERRHRPGGEGGGLGRDLGRDEGRCARGGEAGVADRPEHVVDVDVVGVDVPRRPVDQDDPEPTVAQGLTGETLADRVRLEDVAGRPGAAEGDPFDGVGGDDVGEDLVPGRTVDHDPVVTIAERQGAVDVGADLVPLDDVAGRGRAEKLDPVGRVARDHVARAHDRPADRVARGVQDVDARPRGARAVGDRPHPGRVGADQVADDEVAGGPGARDRHADRDVARDQVRVAERQAADRVVRRLVDQDADQAVADRLLAHQVGADVVAIDEVAGGGRAVDPDPGPLEGRAVARDHVARPDERAGGVEDQDSGDPVADRRLARQVCADQVVPDQGRRTRLDRDPDVGVARDQVRVAQVRPTDRDEGRPHRHGAVLAVADRSPGQLDAVEAVADRLLAGLIGADQVADDEDRGVASSEFSCTGKNFLNSLRRTPASVTTLPAGSINSVLREYQRFTDAVGITALACEDCPASNSGSMPLCIKMLVLAEPASPSKKMAGKLFRCLFPVAAKIRLDASSKFRSSSRAALAAASFSFSPCFFGLSSR